MAPVVGSGKTPACTAFVPNFIDRCLIYSFLYRLDLHELPANLQFFSRYSYIWAFPSEQENAYLNFTYTGNHLSLRLVNLLVMLGMAIFIVVDWFRQLDYSASLTIRLITLFVAFLFLVVAQRKALAALQVEFLIGLSLANLIVFALVASSVAHMPPFFLTNILITVLVLVPTISGLRLRWSLFVNSLFFLLFIAYSQLIRVEPFYFTQYPNLTSIFIYSALAGVVVESRRRRSFLQFRDLQLQKELVDELNQQKNKIISILSHDVASPLRSLAGLLDLQRKDQIKPEEMKTYLGDVGNRLESMSALLNSLVRWSKSQMDGFVPNRMSVNLKSLVQSCLALFQEQANRKSVKIIFASPELSVVSDADMVELVVRNLLSNAVKFSPPSSSVEITIEQADDHVRIRVANQGAALNKELKDKLFSYQMQSTAGTTGEKGSGLGLAMSSNFAQLMGGRLYLDESRSGWITFCLELPLAR